MKNSYVIYSFGALIITLFISSCLVEPKFPNEPSINFNSINFTYHPEYAFGDSLATISVAVDFKDGNGDLGHNASKEDDPKYHPIITVSNPITGKDSIVSNPDFPNFYISLLVKNAAGEFEPYSIPGGLTLDGAFKRLNNDQKAKPIEGTITYNQKVGSGLAGIISEKTIKFRVRVKDREFNFSNEILTDSLQIPQI